jgi:hypothetical protein
VIAVEEDSLRERKSLWAGEKPSFVNMKDPASSLVLLRLMSRARLDIEVVTKLKRASVFVSSIRESEN